MAANRAFAELDEVPIEYDGPIDTVEVPGPVSGTASESPAQSGTFDSIPRMWDVEEAVEASTAANSAIIQFAKLSNAKTLPRIVRPPRPGEPIDRRASHLLQFIDGRTPLGIIFESAGVAEGDAVVVLAQLVDLGIIAVR